MFAILVNTFVNYFNFMNRGTLTSLFASVYKFYT
jgi:hypothetical protein